MQQRASTGTLRVLRNFYCDGLVHCAPPSASAGLVAAQTNLHFLYACGIFFGDFYFLPVPGQEKVVGAPEDQLKTFT